MDSLQSTKSGINVVMNYMGIASRFYFYFHHAQHLDMFRTFEKSPKSTFLDKFFKSQHFGIKSLQVMYFVITYEGMCAGPIPLFGKITDIG